MFAKQTAEGTCTIFLLLHEHGPGDYQDLSMRKAEVMTWTRLYVIWVGLYEKACIRQRHKELWRF